MRTATVVLLLGVLAVICTVAMTGCPRQEDRTGQITPSTGPEETPTATGETGQAEVGEAGAFQWTETPQLADIPEGQVTGMINGQAFTANTVRLKQSDEETVLEISDATLESPTDMIIDDTGLDLRFTATAGQPFTLVLAMGDEKDFDKEHAYYHYPLPDEGGPMSVNTSWASALEISEWTLQADPNNADIMGNAKGKVAVCFNDDAKSWVAGTFDCVYYK